jgi:hypothetical protein
MRRLVSWLLVVPCEILCTFEEGSHGQVFGALTRWCQRVEAGRFCTSRAGRRFSIMRTDLCSPLLVDSTSWIDVSSRVACPPIRVVQVLDLLRTPTRKHLMPQDASSKNGID